MLKTMSLKIIHHLICQCENLNNTYERLSLLMYILHQEGSFFHCPFFTDLLILFLEFAYSTNRFLLCSNTSSIICVQIFAVTDMSECPTQRLQMRQICRNIISSSCWLIRLENSQQSAYKVLLNNKMLLLYFLRKKYNHIIKPANLIE